MDLFLTSNAWWIKKVDWKKIPIRLFEKNDFVVNLKNCVKSYEKFVLVASDPYNYAQNDMYLDLDIKALELSWLKFEQNLVLDYRSKGNESKILAWSSLVFLAWWDTYQQNLFFNDINLGQYLKNLDCCIVWISAWSINCACSAFNSPVTADDLNNPCIFSWLWLCDISIEPHFDVESENTIQMDSIYSESYNRVIYWLPDWSYILNGVVYGECYKIHNWKIELICEDGKILRLS